MDDELTLTGELWAIGDMQPEDAPQIVGVPMVQIQMPGGRIVTLSGLTREECRRAALLLSGVTITIQGDGHG